MSNPKQLEYDRRSTAKAVATRLNNEMTVAAFKLGRYGVVTQRGDSGGVRFYAVRFYTHDAPLPAEIAID